MKKFVIFLLPVILFLTGCNANEKNVARDDNDAYTGDVNSAFNQSQVTLKVKAND